MHPTYNLFLALYLGHLLTDFVFQTDRLVSEKQGAAWRGYARHGIIHYAVVAGVVALADPHRLLQPFFQAILVALSAAHLVIDWSKLSLTGSLWSGRRALAYALDQALHLLTVLGAALIATRPPLQELHAWVARARVFQEKALLLLVVYVAVVFGGGYFVSEVLKSLLKDETGQPEEERKETIHNGLYIGWLERALVLTALALQSPSTVGFILAGKSIVRFTEMKSLRFAEYFLIGTLLSITIALGGAILLLKGLFGSVTLGK